MKIGNTIYLDHHATTPIDEIVLNAMSPYYCKKFGNPHSSHYLGWEANKAIEAARQKVARIINCDSDELFFTSGASEANSLGVSGLVWRKPKKKNKILVSSIEHKSVLEASFAVRRLHNIEVLLIPVNDEGFIDLDFVQRNLRQDIYMLSVSAVNSEVGTVQQVKEIGKICRSNGIIFHCDAAQAPCATNIDVFDQNIDLLSLSAHKIYGPKGIGAIFIRRELHKMIEPIIYGGGQQNGIRPGTLPTQLCVGLGAASRLATSKESKQGRKRLKKLTKYFEDNLKEMKWPIHRNGPDLEMRHPGNLNVRFEGFDGRDILSALQPYVSASTGSACSSGIEQASYVLRAMGLNEEEALSSIRFGLGRFTTKEDIDEATAHIYSVLSRLS